MDGFFVIGLILATGAIMIAGSIDRLTRAVTDRKLMYDPPKEDSQPKPAPAPKEEKLGDGVHPEDIKWMLGQCADCGQTFAGLIPTVIFTVPGGIYTPRGTPFLCARCWCDKNPEPEEGSGDGAKNKPKPPHGGYPDAKVEEAQKAAHDNTVNPGLATTVEGVVSSTKPIDPAPKEMAYGDKCVNCNSTKNLIESMRGHNPTGIYYCRKCINGLRK